MSMPQKLKTNLLRPLTDSIKLANEVNPQLVELIVIQRHLLQLQQTKPWYLLAKTVFDFSLSLIVTILILPAILVAMLAIRIESPGPALIRQKRLGKGFQIVDIFKLRTMYREGAVGRPAPPNAMSGVMFKNPDDPRVTRVGRFLRRWSLDEAPQLFNVLLGEMALVGPRPLPLDQSSGIPPIYFDRFAVKPGLTGLWQVRCRDSLDSARKLRLDCIYVYKRGWKLDLWILWRTLATVFHGRGAW